MKTRSGKTIGFVRLLAIFLCLSVTACTVSIFGTDAFVASAENKTTTEKEKKIAYVSTLGELLSYTYDYFTDTNDYINRIYEEYTLVLTQDMDLATDTSWHEYAPTWEQTGWPARSIYADIEGGGHTIYNMWSRPLDVNDGGRVAALFWALDGDVSNLNIVYDESKAMPAQDNPWDYYGDYGGLAYNAHGVTVSNVHVKGKFIAAGTVGGVVNWPNNKCEFYNCSFEGEINAVEAGGIIYNACDTTIIQNCLFKGKLSGAGLSAISSRHIITSDSEHITYDSNVAIIENLEYIDMGIYKESFYPVGVLAGFVLSQGLEKFEFKNNYAYIDKNITDTIWDIALQQQDEPGIVVIGGAMEAYDLQNGELQHIADYESLRAETTFAGLDFDAHWYIDADLGYPVTKRNFVSVIDLSSSSAAECYNLQTEDRYYGADESAEIEFSLKDSPEYQLVCFSIDGNDARNLLQEGKISLPASENHIVVIKAAPLGVFTFEYVDGIGNIRINGDAVEPVDGKVSVKYRQGDAIEFSFDVLDGYKFNWLVNSAGTEMVERDGVYTVSIPDANTVEPMLTASVKISVEEVTATPPENNDTVIVVAVSVSVAVAVVVATIVVLALKRKRLKA